VKDFVGFADLLEALFGLLIAWIAVRVEFHRELPIGLLELVIRRRSGNTQDLVVIPPRRQT
jgi:hypothetical protein